MANAKKGFQAVEELNVATLVLQLKAFKFAVCRHLNTMK